MSVGMGGCSRELPEANRNSPTVTEVPPIVGQESLPPSEVDSEIEPAKDAPTLLAETERALEAGDLRAAGTAIRSAVSIDPANPQLVFTMALVLGQEHRYPEAVLMLDDLAKKVPEAQLPALGQTAEWLVAQGKWDDAESRYRAVLDAVPEASMAHRQLAQLLIRQGRRLEAAKHLQILCQQGNIEEAELRTLISLATAFAPDLSNPDLEPIGPLGKARYAFSLGDWNNAASELQSLKSRTPHESGLLGRAYAEKSDFDKLQAWANETPSAENEVADSWFARGVLASHQDDHRLAVRFFCAAVSADPTDAQAYARLADSLSKLSANEQAAEAKQRSAWLVKTREIASQMSATQERDLSKIAELASLLDKLRRPLESLSWQAVRIAYGRSTMQEQEQQKELAKINAKRIESLNRKEPAASQPFVLCGVDLDAISSEVSATPIDAVVDQVVRHANEHADGKVAFSFDQSAYQQSMTELPIGVFDSGIGGLTVLEAIRSLDAFNNDNVQPGPDGRLDFENERFVYLGDQANMPYGNYASQGKEGFLRELILKDTMFLLGRRSWDSASSAEPRFDKPPVKAIVIACNTATAYGLNDVRQAIEAWGMPVFVVGVVEAGARGVNELIQSTEAPKTVAVMATMGTCASMAYPKAIGLACGQAGKRAPQVIQQGSAALAGAIEGDPSTLKEQGQSQSEAIADHIQSDLTSLVESYRQSGAKQPIDMVVLGCTHFPLVQDEITRELNQLRSWQPDGDDTAPYRHLIAEQVQIVNPAELVAKELFRQLALNRLRIGKDVQSQLKRDAFYISVSSDNVASSNRTPTGELTSEYKYGRDPGQFDVEDTRVVPLQIDQLPETSKNLIQTRLPKVWSSLSAAAASVE